MSSGVIAWRPCDLQSFPFFLLQIAHSSNRIWLPYRFSETQATQAIPIFHSNTSLRTLSSFQPHEKSALNTNYQKKMHAPYQGTKIHWSAPLPHQIVRGFIVAPSIAVNNQKISLRYGVSSNSTRTSGLTLLNNSILLLDSGYAPHSRTTIVSISGHTPNSILDCVGSSGGSRSWF